MDGSLENAFVTAAIELNVLPAEVTRLGGTQKGKSIAQLFRATQAASFN
jgi:hypothetical protein